MSNEELKEILIALIENNQFTSSTDNEETAREIAKFETAYFEELKK